MGQMQQQGSSHAGNDALLENSHHLDNSSSVAMTDGAINAEEERGIGKMSMVIGGGSQLSLAQLAQQQERQVLRIQRQQQRQRQHHLKDRSEATAVAAAAAATAESCSPNLGVSVDDLRLLLEEYDEGVDCLNASFSATAASGNSLNFGFNQRSFRYGTRGSYGTGSSFRCVDGMRITSPGAD